MNSYQPPSRSYCSSAPENLRQSIQLVHQTNPFLRRCVLAYRWPLLHSRMPILTLILPTPTPTPTVPQNYTLCLPSPPCTVKCSSPFHALQEISPVAMSWKRCGTPMKAVEPISCHMPYIIAAGSSTTCVHPGRPSRSPPAGAHSSRHAAVSRAPGSMTSRMWYASGGGAQAPPACRHISMRTW